MVDLGEVDAAVINSDDETFVDEDGKLNIEWKSGQVISSTRLNQMVQYLNDVEERVDFTPYATKEDIVRLEEGIDDVNNILENEVDIIKNDIEDTKNIINDASGNLGSVSNSYDYMFDDTEPVIPTVGFFKHLQTEAKGYVDDIKDYLYDDVAPRVDTNEAFIADIQSNMITEDMLNDYALKSDTTSLDTRLGEVSDRVTTNENAIEALESEVIVIKSDMVYPDMLDDYPTREEMNQAISGMEVPDLSDYVTTEYVETNYYNKVQVVATCTTPARVEKMINDTIGDINSILDAINGEVI